MNIQEYQEKIAFLKKVFETAEMNIKKEFALSNNTICINDIITDNSGSIKVEKIGFYISFSTNLSECTYNGVILNAKGVPDKKNKKRTVYQSHIKKHNENDYTLSYT